MLVDVVVTRWHGQPRPRDVVRAAAGVRGKLQLLASRPGWYAGQRNAPLLAGLLIPGQASWALPPLDHACVRKIWDDNLYIVGFEQIQHDRRSIVTYRQGWWCRLVDGSSPRARQASSGFVEREHLTFVDSGLRDACAIHPA